MNKDRRKAALRRNIEMTQGALQHACQLIENRAIAAVTFPANAEQFVDEMKHKIAAYQKELDELDKIE